MHKKIFAHIGFWLAFLFLWSAHDLVYHSNFFELLVSNSYTFILYALLVYFNLYVLVPKFLLKNKLTLYFLFVLITIIVIVFSTSWNLYIFFTKIKTHMPTALFFLSNNGKITILTEILVLTGFSMAIYLLNQWHQKTRYAVEVEQKKLEAELQQLKNQVNPHFLFNSLNSIYIMLGKNVSAGKKMLLQFSDILSHQLYEANKERIPLKKEFENLCNYIEIEKIRHQDLAKVNIDLSEETERLEISPMLLLPIVENAFKHGQSNDGYWIYIKAEILKNRVLKFTVENSRSNTNKKTKKGIGLDNLKRRLELIYPNVYDLLIYDEESTFKVILKLELDEN